MSLIDSLIVWIKDKRTPVVVGDTVMINDMIRLIRDQTKCEYGAIYISDTAFNLVSDADVQRAYRYFATKYQRKYKIDLWDCDNSAQTCTTIMKLWFIKQGINPTIGFTWTVSHALVIYVNTEHKVRFLESFTGDIVEVDKRLRFVII